MAGARKEREKISEWWGSWDRQTTCALRGGTGETGTMGTLFGDPIYKVHFGQIYGTTRDNHKQHLLDW